MKLISSPTSPFARKVRIVLAEKKIDCPVVELSPWDDAEAVARYNPLGKVPVLELDDGSTLFDSRVIAEYLDSISPVSRLYPQERRALVETRRWEALADGVCDALVAAVIERRRPEALQSTASIERQLEKVERGLAAMADALGERVWCNGEAYGIADIACGCCLDYVSLRLPELDWRERHPVLAQHADKLAARPAFAETRPA